MHIAERVAQQFLYIATKIIASCENPSYTQNVSNQHIEDTASIA